MFWLRNKKNNFQLHTLIWGLTYGDFCCKVLSEDVIFIISIVVAATTSRTTTTVWLSRKEMKNLVKGRQRIISTKVCGHTVIQSHDKDFS